MGKYMKYFDTEEEFLVFKNSDEFSNNTVSFVREDGSTWFGPIKRLPAEIDEIADNIIIKIINTPV